MTLLPKPPAQAAAEASLAFARATRENARKIQKLSGTQSAATIYRFLVDETALGGMYHLIVPLTNAQIMAGTGYSKPTVIACLKWLEEHNFIEVSIKGPNGRQEKAYGVLHEGEQNFTGDPQITGKATLPVKPLYRSSAPQVDPVIEINSEDKPREDLLSSLKEDGREEERLEQDPRSSKEDQEQDQDQSARARKKSDRERILDELCEHFSQTTGLPLPDNSTARKASAASTSWYQPLLELYSLFADEWGNIRYVYNATHLESTMRLVELTVQSMRDNKLTIAAPRSILNVARSQWADTQGRVGSYSTNDFWDKYK